MSISRSLHLDIEVAGLDGEVADLDRLIPSYARHSTLRIIQAVTYARLPESVHTLYAEILDQLRAADAELGISGSGSFVSKQIKGRTYWYL